MIFIKITLPGSESGYIDTPDKAKSIIDEMVHNADDGDMDQCYEFSIVEMTQEQFDSLPEFRGF